MPKEENFEGKIVYKCEKCGWLYKSKKWAQKCEDYCGKNHSCSLDITKHAIKNWKNKK